MSDLIDGPTSASQPLPKLRHERQLIGPLWTVNAQASVHRDGDACDEPGAVRGQEDDQVRDVLGPPEPRRKLMSEHHLCELCWHVLGCLCHDEPGSDRDAAD